MARNAAQALHPVEVEGQAQSEDDRIAAFDAASEQERVEPTSPSNAARQQAFRLVEMSPPVTPLIAGGAAVIVGGAVGYWLGARRQQPVARRAKKTAVRAEQALELLPAAAKLLANPAVRALVIKMLMRRLSIAA